MKSTHSPMRVPATLGVVIALNTSRVTSITNSDWASNFFSRAFSVSSSRSRFASGTVIPPNLLRCR